jgi:serpin B
MKIVFAIIAMVAMFLSLAGNNADAMCVIDNDWPDKPCYDTSPPLPLSKSEWKKVWDPYYDYKGKEWMEQKKSELDEQIQSGTLKEWIESGYTEQDFANYNVWFYYYVNNKVPAPEGYELDSQIRDEVLSPLKQVRSGIDPNDVVCKSGFELVFRSNGSFPTCVKPTTASILVQRDWASTVWIPPSIPAEYDDVTIKLERTPCFGFCPAYTVSIHGNGTVVYEGHNFVQTKGLKVYEIPADKIKELVTLVYDANYFSLSDLYDAPVTDLPSAITTITIGDKTKSIHNYGNTGPQKLEDLEIQIDEITKSKDLVGEPTFEQPVESDPVSFDEYVNLNNRLGFEMFANLAQEENKNIFFSPYSISNAFSILYEGTRGTTQEEIQSVFHFIKDDQTRRDYSNQIISELNEPSKNYILSTANALWIQDKFPILDEYKYVTETYYLSQTENLDFVTQPEESRQTINKWVEEKTNDKIKDLLPQGSIDDMTRAVITNAVYFLGNWTVQFDEKLTKEDDFKISETETTKVTMMNVEQSFEYGSTDDLQILKMSYKGEDLSMLVLLPKESDLDSLEKKLSVENLNEWRNTLAKKQVNVYLPKFKLESSYSLVDNLTQMGMPTVFEAGNADLTGIYEMPDLYVTGVFHKAFVSVDEKGTEAAAATGIVVGVTSVGPTPEIFRADHPFIFLIQDERTGSILFLGKVTDPTKSQ